MMRGAWEVNASCFASIEPLCLFGNPQLDQSFRRQHEGDRVFITEEVDEVEMSQESRPLLLKEPESGPESPTYRATIARENTPEEPPFAHTIGPFGSFALIMNNLTGPAMLGFPSLFQKAGVIPVTVSTVFAWIASSLCGTLMADAIASIKGNEDFSRQVDFSAAFRLIVGKDWYVVAEVLFLMSCAVQACASLVEAAQSLDGFIASFLVGRTAALQLYPTLSFITWDTSGCHEETEFVAESTLEDCTPFHTAGPLICSAGFLLTSLMFLPLGLGHLKETIGVQIFSMLCMFVLLAQFSFEFAYRGLDYDLPWVGTELSQLAGVVLFNYAFSITVPSWLSEKDRSVSVNRTVWSASTSASAIYMLFGIMGGMSFENAGPNILISLASNKVHHLTRFCAALFGVTIIGCGVPVFCVIIKTGLQASGLCSPSWALFFGGFCPYLLSWMLYQGTILMSILNWAGLVINGLVAFMLPMILALKAIELRTRSPHRVTLTVQAQPSVLHREENAHFQPSNPSHHHHTSSPNGKHTDGHSSVSVGVHDVHHADVNADVEMRRLPASIQPSTLHAPASPTHSDKHAHTHADAQEEDSMHLSWSDRSLLISLSTSNHLDRPLHSLMGLHSVENSERTIATVSSADTLDILHHGTVRRLKTNTIVQPLPEYLEAYRREIVIFMIASFAVIILTTIMEDAINGILIPE